MSRGVDRNLGRNRLMKEFKQQVTATRNGEPNNGIYAQPNPENWFEWFYLFEPEQPPFKGGQYFGKILLPEQYPFKPPELYMLTPNGRFEPGKKICTSMSSYHPETWDSAWSTRTVLLGLLSFLYEDSKALGTLKSTLAEKKQLAKDSWRWNASQKMAVELFEERIRKEPPGGSDESGASTSASSPSTPSYTRTARSVDDRGALLAAKPVASCPTATSTGGRRVASPSGKTTPSGSSSKQAPQNDDEPTAGTAGAMDMTAGKRVRETDALANKKRKRNQSHSRLEGVAAGIGLLSAVGLGILVAWVVVHGVMDEWWAPAGSSRSSQAGEL